MLSINSFLICVDHLVFHTEHILEQRSVWILIWIWREAHTKLGLLETPNRLDHWTWWACHKGSKALEAITKLAVFKTKSAESSQHNSFFINSHNKH